MCANMSRCLTPAAADSLKRCSQDLIMQGQMPNGGAVVAFVLAGLLLLVVNMKKRKLWSASVFDRSPRIC